MSAVPGTARDAVSRMVARHGVSAAVVIGGAIGATLRLALDEALPVQPGRWPWATFVANVAGQLSQLALTVAVAVGGGSVVWFALPAVIGEVVIFVWKLIRVRRIQRIRLNIDWATWKSLLGEAAPLAAGTVMATFYYRVDSVMLSRLDTFASVGIYNVAYKFVDLVQYLPTALMVPVLALFVRSWPGDMPTFSETFRRSPIRTGITRSRWRLRSSISRSSTLSTATWVDAQRSARFPCFASSAPVVPHTHDQKLSETRMASGLMVRRLPTIIGVTKFASTM